MAPATLPQRFYAYLQQHHLFSKEDRLLIAVSGGLDSAVLCHLCHTAGFSFAVAHCNFGLRRAESTRDEAFVQLLAEQYQVPFLLKQFETEKFAAQHKLSIQEAARTLRYDWFDVLLKGGADEPLKTEMAPPKASNVTPPTFNCLLTAHHLDDNIETAAMNFFKGTGISGLRGMLPRQGKIVRPLLFAKRSELEDYAAEQNLQWVEDSSNVSVKYTRNFFRHEVLPLVAQKYPQAMDNLAASLPRFAETEMLYQQAVADHKKKLLEYRGSEVHIPVLKLIKTEPLNTVLYEIIKPFGFSPGQVADVAHLLHSDTGRYIRSATHQVIRHRRWLVIAPLVSEAPSLIVVEQGEEQVVYGAYQLQVQETELPEKIPALPHIAVLDARQLKFPLVLRRWKAGDYFYPLGLGKKKKLSRFLIDLKLSKSEKEQVWVLESGKKIAWVVGLRIDERFKVTPATRRVVRLTSSPLPAGTSARH